MYVIGATVDVLTSTQLPGISWDGPVDLSRREVQVRLGPSAVKAFLELKKRWNIRDEDARALLGGVSNGAFYDLKRRPARPLDQDKLTRISLLLGIFKALSILYSKKLADAWVQLANSNPMFADDTPLSYMLKGGMPAMMRIRQLLDARRGGS
jgi:hypothetical protein